MEVNEFSPSSPQSTALCVLESSVSFSQLQGQEILRWQETISVTTPPAAWQQLPVQPSLTSKQSSQQQHPQHSSLYLHFLSLPPSPPKAWKAAWSAGGHISPDAPHSAIPRANLISQVSSELELGCNDS